MVPYYQYSIMGPRSPVLIIKTPILPDVMEQHVETSKPTVFARGGPWVQGLGLGVSDWTPIDEAVTFGRVEDSYNAITKTFEDGIFRTFRSLS